MLNVLRCCCNQGSTAASSNNDQAINQAHGMEAGGTEWLNLEGASMEKLNR